MNKTTKKILLQYILSPILLGVFFYLVYLQIKTQGSFWNQWNKFKTGFQLKNLFWLIPVIAMAPLNWTMEGYKWQILLEKIEHISLKKAFVAVLSGIAFAFVTPNKTGDFLGRIIFLKKESRLKGTIASLMGSLAQISITFVFGFLGMIYLHIFHPGKWTLAVLLASGIGMILLIFFFINIRLLSKLSGKIKSLRLLAISLYLFKRYSRKELIRVLNVSFLRFCIYNCQFLILLYIFHSGIQAFSGFVLSGLMFWLITVIPTFFIADIGVRGFVTGLVFISTGVTQNPFAVLAASYFLWLINIVLPAVIGGVIAIGVSFFRQKP